jgi:hypothetical protein
MATFKLGMHVVLIRIINNVKFIFPFPDRLYMKYEDFVKTELIYVVDMSKIKDILRDSAYPARVTHPEHASMNRILIH